MSDTGAIELQVTYPDEEQASTAARDMVLARLAACGQISKVRSVFMWEGAVDDAPEWLLTLKTTTVCLPALEHRLRASHPYDTPQITALPITWAAQDYLDWVRQQCAPKV